MSSRHFSCRTTIPDESTALEKAANGTLVPDFASKVACTSKLPPEVVTRTEGLVPNQVLVTDDPKLRENGLPEYPPLPCNFDLDKLNDTRRTILVLDVKSDTTPEDLVDFFDSRAGDVAYFRFAMQSGEKCALIEFVRQADIIKALKLQGTKFQGTHLNLTHSTQPIKKPPGPKSKEAAQKDIEDAMSAVVKNTTDAVSVMTVNDVMASKEKGSTSRRHSRTRSPSLEVRSSYRRSKRSRSRDRKRDR